MIQDNSKAEESHFENIKEIVLSEYKKGNIVLANFDGLATMPLSEFIKQPAEGILYDLNRSEAVVLTFIDDPKWINDFAVAKVIQKLKTQIDSDKNAVVSDTSKADSSNQSRLPNLSLFKEELEKEADERYKRDNEQCEHFAFRNCGDWAFTNYLLPLIEENKNLKAENNKLSIQADKYYMIAVGFESELSEAKKEIERLKEEVKEANGRLLDCEKAMGDIQ